MIKDILGVNNSVVKNVVFLNEKLQVRSSNRYIPLGVPREVSRFKGSSLTSLPVQTSFTNHHLTSGTRSVTRWVRCQMKNSSKHWCAHLHCWTRVTDATPHECNSLQTNFEFSKALPSESALDGLTAATTNSVTAVSHDSVSVSSSQNPPCEKKFQCCNFITKFEHPAFLYCKKNQVVRYNPSLYQKYFLNLDMSWSSWETDYLFDLCVLFDLKFTIIHDRYIPVQLIQESIETLSKNPPCEKNDTRHQDILEQKLRANSQTFLASVRHLYTLKLEHLHSLLESVRGVAPRPLEQLKQRYYSIAKRIVEHDYNKTIQSIERRFSSLAGTVASENIEILSQQKAQLLASTKAEMARHPLIRSPYDINADRQRREFLENQYKMSETSLRKQHHLIQEIVCRQKNLKRNPKNEDALVSQNRKKKKTGFPHSTSISPCQESGFSFQQILNESIWCSKPGVILASQVMQQFAASILLEPATGPLRSSLNVEGSSVSGSGPREATPSFSHYTGTGNHMNHRSSATSISAMKRHKERIEAELKALGFGTPSLPFWPIYRNREIVEAFNTLRVNIVTLINLNTHIEQLEKEKTLWKSKVSQLKEENRGIGVSSTTCDILSKRTSYQLFLPALPLSANKTTSHTMLKTSETTLCGLDDASSRKSQTEPPVESERSTLSEKNRKCVPKKSPLSQ